MVVTATLRWAIALASAGSAALAFVAFAAGRPRAFLSVFAADLAIAALATIATEYTLDPAGAAVPAPEELALYGCLHCGVIAMLMLTFPDGLPGAALLAFHQALLLISAKRLPVT